MAKSKREAADESRDSGALPWRDLPKGFQLILNSDFLAKEYRRNARQELVEQEVNDRRAAVIAYLEEIGPQTINDLARRLEQHKAAISALLIRMEADGLVEFTPNPHDKRSKNAGLTAKGLSLAQPIQTALWRVRHRALVGITEQEVDATNAVLQKVIANLARIDAAAEES